MLATAGVITQQIPSLSLPTLGLVSALDGSIATSFWSDDGKTTNSTEGGAVAVWEDQSGNGNDWYQTNASYRPLAHLSAGRLYNNGTQGTSTSVHLIGPNISGWTSGSFFARVQNVNNSQGGIWGTTTWNSASSTNHWAYSGDNGTLYVCFGGFNRGSIAWSSLTPSSLDLINYEENITSGGIQTIYLNGSPTVIMDYPGVGFRTTPYLGCGVRSTLPAYSGGFHFYKFCCYSRVVTTEERTQINAWLSS